MNDGLRVRVGTQGDATVVVSEAVEGLDNYLERWPREPFEVIAASVTLSRLVNRKIAPHEVTFRHQAPPSIAEHVRISGLKPRFEAPENRVVFRSGDLEAPVISADPVDGVLRHVQKSYLSKDVDAMQPHVPAAGTGCDRLRACESPSVVLSPCSRWP